MQTGLELFGGRFCRWRWQIGQGGLWRTRGTCRLWSPGGIWDKAPQVQPPLAGRSDAALRGGEGHTDCQLRPLPPPQSPVPHLPCVPSLPAWGHLPLAFREVQRPSAAAPGPMENPARPLLSWVHTEPSCLCPQSGPISSGGQWLCGGSQAVGPASLPA